MSTRASDPNRSSGTAVRAAKARPKVGARVDRVIARVGAETGNVALFAHGHVFRVLVARWIGLSPGAGQHFLLDTATLNILGYYADSPAIKVWNAPLAR